MMANIRGFLGLKRNPALLLATLVLIGTGEEMWMRFVPKYLESLGAAALVIGLYDAIYTLLGAVYAYPGGVVVDRWGHRRALTAFTAVSIAGYAMVLAVHHWAAVLAAMFLFLAWSDLSLPATFSLVAASLPAGQHTMGIGMQSLIKRIPIVIGPLAGGLLMDRYGLRQGFAIGLAASIGLGLVAMALQQRLEEGAQASPRAPARLRALLRDFDPPLRRLLMSDILIRFCERIPHAWVVIYAMDHVGASATQVGLLTAVEMLVAMACYIPVARYADKYGREPFVLATFVFFTLFPLSLLVAGSFPLLVAAFAIRGLKEFGEPPRKALILSYAPAERRGSTVGAYYLVRDLVVSAGSMVGAAAWKYSPRANFWVAAAAGLAGTFLYAATGKRSRSAGVPR
jgi:MFS family permease